MSTFKDVGGKQKCLQKNQNGRTQKQKRAKSLGVTKEKSFRKSPKGESMLDGLTKATGKVVFSKSLCHSTRTVLSASQELVHSKGHEECNTACRHIK